MAENYIDTLKLGGTDIPIQDTDAQEKLGVMGDELSSVKSAISNVEFAINPDDSSILWRKAGEKGVSYTDGTLVTSAVSACTDYINISAFKQITYKRMRTTASTTATGMAWYSGESESSFISGISSVVNASDNYPVDYTVNVPSNAKYARFTYRKDTDTYGDFSISGVSKIYSAINDVNIKIKDKAENLITPANYGESYYTPQGLSNDYLKYKFFHCKINVTPGETLYSNVRVNSLNCGFLDENDNFITNRIINTDSDGITVIQVPNNNSIAKLAMTISSIYECNMVVSREKITGRYNGWNRTDDKATLESYSNMTKPLLCSAPDIINFNLSSYNVPYFTINQSASTYNNYVGKWVCCIYDTTEAVLNAYMVSFAFDTNYVYFMYIAKTKYEIYRMARTPPQGDFVTLYSSDNNIFDISSIPTIARRLYCRITENGEFYFREELTGVNMIVDVSPYLTDGCTLAIGNTMIIGAGGYDYYNYALKPGTRITGHKVFRQTNLNNLLKINIANWFTWTERVLALRMLADAQGCYFIPFNALGMGRNRGNGLYGNDYVADQIHPTVLGGYNVACGVWSYLKNIPLWHTSIPSGTEAFDGSQWNGKKWFAYGTSLTKESSGHYADLVASMSGMNLTNYGIGGGALVTNRNIYNQLLDMTDGKLTADLITIEVGANDTGALGNPWSIDTDEFCGALNHCIKAMFDAGVQAQIVIMASYPSRYKVNDPSVKYDVNKVNGLDPA